MTTRELVCATGASMVMDYCEGILRAGRRSRLESHVAGCPRCRAFLRSYRKTPAIVSRATRTRAPRTLARTVLRFVRRRTAG